MIGSIDGYALVTGASSGIGYELAKLFARDGKNIIVVARSQDKLEELKTEIENKYGTNVRVLVKDLSDPNSPQEIYSELERENINVDVLVNNAGFAVYGMFAETDWGKESEMIQVNIISLTYLTKLFLKHMLENKSGNILNVSSLGGFLPYPWYSVYAATKAHVLHFSEALANELGGSGVSVTCLCPGATETLFWERSNSKDSRGGKGRLMDAAKVAVVGYKALKKGKVIAIPGLIYNFTPIAVRIVPRSRLARIARFMAEPI
jgi:short-subunit dehydrogenase